MAQTHAQRKQAAELLAKLRTSLMPFVDVLVIDTDDGPRRFGEVADEWQRRELEAFDPPCRRVIGQQVEVKHSRLWWELARGHAKTTSLAIVVAWLLFASARKIDGAAFAADQEQAALIRNAIDKLIRLNPWLGEFIECNKLVITNPSTGSTFTISSANVPSSWGLLLDFIVLDECTVWPNRDLWDSIISTAAKRSHCFLTCITNAGYKSHWTWPVREAIRVDPSWRFSRLDGPVASWISAPTIDEQRRLLPPHVFDRVWLNNWQEVDATAIDNRDVEACCVLQGVQPRRQDRVHILSVDIGIKRNHTAAVCLAISPGQQSVEVANIWSLNPRDYGGRIELDAIQQMILKAHETYRFAAIVFDPWQAYFLMDSLAATGICTVEFPFTPQNRDLIARSLIESLQSRSLKLYRHAGLLADLGKLRVSEASHLGLRLEAPQDGTTGAHCDIGFAMAMGLPIAFEIARTGLAHHYENDRAEVLTPV